MWVGGDIVRIKVEYLYNANAENGSSMVDIRENFIILNAKSNEENNAYYQALIEKELGIERAKIISVSEV